MSEIENPGSLQAFMDQGGTQESWYEHLDAFRHQQEALGSDTDVLRGSVCVIEVCSDTE